MFVFVLVLNDHDGVWVCGIHGNINFGTSQGAFFVNKCLVNSYLSLLNDFTVIFEFICCRNPKISTDGY